MSTELSTSGICPECNTEDTYLYPVQSDPVTRRVFLNTMAKTVGGIAVAAAGMRTVPALARQAVQGAAPGSSAAGAHLASKPETLVKSLYDSLSPAQRAGTCMAWDHTKRTMVGANWAIVDATLEKQFNPDQQEMIRGIVRGLTTEEWYPKILSQMQNDAGGFGKYHVALFGDPDKSKFEFVITGRHLTLRADGHSNANAAFGGPIFYGHAIKDTEDAGHPGNIYWEQGKKANAVLAALDPKQRDIALLDKAPNEDRIKLQGTNGLFPGIAIGELTKDQKALVYATMHDILSPYRPSDAKDVMADIAANGGLDKIHLSFYKQDHLGSDGVWDIWRLEGPAMVWHFRGAPHVHTWVNVAKDPVTADGHV